MNSKIEYEEINKILLLVLKIRMNSNMIFG
jgi:hypothetical protein